MVEVIVETSAKTRRAKVDLDNLLRHIEDLLAEYNVYSQAPDSEWRKSPSGMQLHIDLAHKRLVRIQNYVNRMEQYMTRMQAWVKDHYKLKPNCSLCEKSLTNKTWICGACRVLHQPNTNTVPPETFGSGVVLGIVLTILTASILWFSYKLVG